MRRYAAGAWDPQGEVYSSTATTNAGAPATAVDAAGVITAVWLEDFTTDHAKVYASRYSNGSWSTPAILLADANAANSAGEFRVVASKAGEATVVWSSFDVATQNKAISSCRYFGGGWGSVVDITTASGQEQVRFPRAVADPFGVVTVAWSEMRLNSSTHKASQFVDGNWSAPQSFTPSGDVVWPELAVDGSGIVTAVWSQSDSGREHLYMNRCLQGSWGTPVKVDKYSGNFDYPSFSNPVVIASGQGEVTIGWVGSNNTPLAIYAVRYAGGVLSQPVEVCPGVDNTAAPLFAVDGSGAVTMVWSTRNGIAEARYSGGSWSPVKALNTEGNTVLYGRPAVVSDSIGNVTVAWEQQTSPGVQGIYVVRGTL